MAKDYAYKMTRTCSFCAAPMWEYKGPTVPICRTCRQGRGVGHKARTMGCAEPIWSHCWTCGTPMSKRRGTRYCSRPCHPSSTKQGRKRDLECSWCGKAFDGEPNKGHDPVCGQDCQTYLMLYRCGHVADPWHPGIAALWSSKERRRARIRMTQQQPINRDLIFKRDRYRCHICGQRTSRQVRVPHPRAATIDHIVPLARGGTHTLDNVATACFSCNVAKGHRLAS